MTTTEAWVLHGGPMPTEGDRRRVPRGSEDTFPSDAFVLEDYELPEQKGTYCLVEPLYGCWEGNFSHAIARVPVDICHQRGESKVVLGNSAVVRVLKPGPDAKHLKEGDVCLMCGNYFQDRYGYMKLAWAYDAPGTIGVLAKRTLLPEEILIPVPKEASYSLAQWAAFTLRYVTAWSNHRIAYGAWRLQVPEKIYPENFPVWAWGGGVSFAQLTLAKIKDGAKGVLIASSESRRKLAEREGIEACDRSKYPDLSYRPHHYNTDPAYAERYRENEKRFLDEVKQRTNKEGVAIFIDNIGEPVFRVTLKALAREGVITTCGWKRGMRLEVLRAVECITRHTHVHTHYASMDEVRDAVKFACEHNWMAPADSLGEVWAWEDMAKLAKQHLTGFVESYFPIFRINPE